MRACFGRYILGGIDNPNLRQEIQKRMIAVRPFSVPCSAMQCMSPQQPRRLLVRPAVSTVLMFPKLKLQPQFCVSVGLCLGWNPLPLYPLPGGRRRQAGAFRSGACRAHVRTSSLTDEALPVSTARTPSARTGTAGRFIPRVNTLLSLIILACVGHCRSLSLRRPRSYLNPTHCVRKRVRRPLPKEAPTHRRP